MNAVRIGILALALVAAGLAAFLARSLVSSEPVAVAEPQIIEAPTAEVLVAATDISLGMRVGKSDLTWQAWPEDAVSGVYITRAAQPNALDVFSGAIARGPLLSGEPVTNGKLVSFDSAGFMSALISPGMRAVATTIGPETSAGGFILPNDRVDVIVTIRETNYGSETGGGGESFRSETFLSNVRVLAIDQTFQEVEGEQVVIGKTATLEMLPEQAEQFTLAEARGSIVLALRSLADSSGRNQVPVSGSALDEDRRSDSGAGGVRVIRFGASASAGSN